MRIPNVITAALRNISRDSKGIPSDINVVSKYDGSPVVLLNKELDPDSKLFICGDVHGCFSLLKYILGQCGFDFEKDILVVAGDIIDRGSENEELIQALKERWLWVVRGNHENFLIKGLDSVVHRKLHQKNGGEWFYTLNRNKQHEIAKKLDLLPYAIEIHYKGLKLGVVHADVYTNDWDVMTHSLQRNKGNNLKLIKSHITLSRAKFKGIRRHQHIQNVDAVFFGHNVTIKPFRQLNTYYIDTGACFFSNLTVLNIDNVRDIIDTNKTQGNSHLA